MGSSSPRRARALSRRWIALLLASGVIALLLLVGNVGTRDPSTSRACPTGSRTIPAQETHLGPHVVQHQSWVGISPTEIVPGQILYICTDDRAIGSAFMDEIDATNAVVRLDVSTRWVNGTWLSGRLDQYADPQRWTIVFPPFANLS